MRRLKFAKEHAHWDVDMWKKVIWTDGISFEIGKQNGTIRVWRRVGEAYKKECLAGTHRSGRSSVMVWGAIRFGEKFWNHNPNLILMEDGAPIHKRAEAKNWKREQAIESLEWSAQSPDLNPIEELIQEAWDSIETETWNVLVESMPRRMEEVIRNKGGSTHCYR
ncbi:hypothetical protein G6F56_004086 [Rhizopus delemar]|nr:hypothetical protein G6F56_004086 [Rhizopus delemar]